MIGKSHGPSEVSLELIVASGGVGIQAMAEICQKVLDRFVMPAEWALSIVAPIFKGKGDIRNSSCNRAMANSVRWYGDVLRREDGHILRRAFDFQVEGQRKERPKRTWKKHGGKKV